MSSDDERRRRGGRTGPVVAVVAVIALLAIVIGLSRGSSSRTPAGGGTTPVDQPSTSAPADLAALTADIPCPGKNLTMVSPDELPDFHAVAVFQCGFDERSYPDGEWSVEIRSAAAPDIAALENALQAPAPPEPTDDNFACAAIGYSNVGPVFVDRRGRYVVAKLRSGVCGAPIGAAAVQAIQWQELSARKVHLDQSLEETAAGCSDRYKNLNYYEDQDPNARMHTGGPVFPDDGALLHACLYRATDGEIDGGTFVRNVTLTAGQSDRLRAAVSGAGPSGSCDPQPDFALVFDGKRSVDVELGGCHRVLSSYTDAAAQVSGTEVGTADGAVLQDLFGQS